MNNKLLYLLWIGVVSSRRSEKAVPETPPPKRVVSQWGYPYGWGLDMPNDDVENHKQIKAVKRVKKKDCNKKERKTGWFGLDLDRVHDFAEHCMDDDLE